MKSCHRNSESSVRSSSANNPLGLKDGKVSKHQSSNKDAITEEMQLYFSKLKELVPFMPKNRKLSKLEIIQYVIDYICDLQLALETQPNILHSHNVIHRQSPNNTVVVVGTPSVTSPNRQPLGVIAAPNNTSLPNTCAIQEASHDKPSSHLDDLSTTRPVSC